MYKTSELRTNGSDGTFYLIGVFSVFLKGLVLADDSVHLNLSELGTSKGRALV
jgi:hypothetical protein